MSTIACIRINRNSIINSVLWNSLTRCAVLDVVFFVFEYLRDRGETSSKGQSKAKRPSGSKAPAGGHGTVVGAGAARLPSATDEVAGAAAS